MTAFLSFPKDGGPHSGASVGQALAGLVARDTSGMPRAGMLAAPAVKAVAASWKVEVGRFVYVHHVNGAIQFSGLSEAEQVDITPATGIPAGQARIDRVVWDVNAGELILMEGAVSASPSAPALGSYAPVLLVRVDSGDGMVVAGKVTPDFVGTAVATNRQSGVVAHPAGGTQLAGGIYRSTANHSVVFPSPFASVPRLAATAVASGASVAQWVQVYSLTRTGFSYRIISVNAAPNSGTVHWEAWPE